MATTNEWKPTLEEARRILAASEEKRRNAAKGQEPAPGTRSYWVERAGRSWEW